MDTGTKSPIIIRWTKKIENLWKKKIREFKNDICLDHSHETGTIRGYICGSCNASIGKFHEKIDRLERAIKWLKGDLKN